MTEVIGKMFQKSSGTEWEWRIRDFLSLPGEVGKGYSSGKFFSSGACWELKIYPNGKLKSEGWIALYLCRKDSGPPLSMGFWLGVRRADGTEGNVFQAHGSIHRRAERYWGDEEFLRRTHLFEQKRVLAPAEVLTVTCTMKVDRMLSMDADLCRRLWNTSAMLQGILTSEVGADVTFKLGDGELRAHRWILKARSEVFNRMFTTDMKESQRGEVDVPESDKDSFSVVLCYIYSGDSEGLSTENMCKVYKIAHRYDLGELARLCVEFMKVSMSLATVCDVIPLVDVYQENDLKDCVTEFFVKNSAEVMKTDKWKSLKSEKLPIVSELLKKIEFDFGPQVNAYLSARRGVGVSLSARFKI